MQEKLKTIGATLGAVAICVLIGWMFYMYQRTSISAGVTVPATVAKEVADVGTETVPVKNIEAYKGGAKVKKKLGLSKTIVEDDSKRIVASSKVAGDYNPHTVTTVLDTATGKFETFDRKDSQPWLAYTSRGGIGVYVGQKRGDQAVRVQARQDVVQVKCFHIGGLASYDRTNAGKSDWFVGLGGECRW